MKIVEVSFTHISRLNSFGKPVKSAAQICISDDADMSDIMQHFETAIDFGWIMTGLETKEECVKVVRLEPAI